MMDHQIRWPNIPPEKGMSNDQRSRIANWRPSFPSEHYSYRPAGQEWQNQQYNYTEKMAQNRQHVVPGSQALASTPTSASGLGYGTAAPFRSVSAQDRAETWNFTLQPRASQGFARGSQTTSQDQSHSTAPSAYNSISNPSGPPFSTQLPTNLSTLHRQDPHMPVPQDRTLTLPRPIVPPLRPQHLTFQSQGHSMIQNVHGATKASGQAEFRPEPYPGPAQTAPHSNELNEVSEANRQTSYHADNWHVPGRKNSQLRYRPKSPSPIQYSRNSESQFIHRPQPLRASHKAKAVSLRWLPSTSSSAPGKPQHLSRRDEYFASKMRVLSPLSDNHSDSSSAARQDLVDKPHISTTHPGLGPEPIVNGFIDTQSQPGTANPSSYQDVHQQDASGDHQREDQENNQGGHQEAYQEDDSMFEPFSEPASHQAATPESTPTTPPMPKPETKKAARKLEFDSDAFDSLIYAETNADKASGLDNNILISSASLRSLPDERLFFYANPATQTMHSRPEEWYNKKTEEIKARGGRKFWFGKVAARQRWINRMRKDQERERKAAVRSGSIPPRRDPEPRGYSRPMNFADVPESELPEYVQDDPEWLKACAWLRQNKTARERRRRTSRY